MLDFRGQRAYSCIKLFAGLILLTGTVVCVSCPPGRYADGIDCIVCEEGYYCAGGTTPRAICDLGAKCPYQEMSEPILCPKGEHSNTEGQTFCYKCAEENYCPSEGTVNGTECPRGQKCLNIVDMAEGANTLQIDDIPASLPAEYANDGDIETCSFTDVGSHDRQHFPWWKLMFKEGTGTTVKNITIITKSEYLDYFRGFTIRVESVNPSSFTNKSYIPHQDYDKVCYQHGDTAPTSTNITIDLGNQSWCSGNQVRIQLTNESFQLVLCEVKIMSHYGSVDHVPRCPLSWYEEVNKTCTKCSTYGSYCDKAGIWEPKKCPIGHYCNTGSTSPTKCPPGRFQRFEGYPFCFQCTLGHYCPTEGLVYHKKCPVNHKCAHYEMINPVPCGEHTYMPQRGQRMCFCEEGYFCENLYDNPRPCPVGHYCTQKPLHYYVLGKAKPPVACEAGTYQPNGGQSICLDCSPGYYCPTTNLTSQISCPMNKKCPNASLASAVPCVEHTYQPEMGKVNCICEEGYYCENIDENPKICPAGHFCIEGESLASCEAGTHQPNEGQSICLDCSPGYYCPTTNLTAPIVCPIDTKCPGMRLTSAVQCIMHTYQPEMGKVNCICEEGYYCENIDENPLKCPVGHFCTQGLASAVPCVEHTYQPEMGKANCICEEGYYCENIDENPKICPVGHFCTQGASPVSCEAGTYQPDKGQSICLDCTPGYYCPTASLTSTTICPINTKCPGMRLASAVPCIEHTYQSETGKVNCICEEGYYCENIDENPKICPVGHFCTQGASLVSCEAGTYQPNEGQSICLDCTPGYYCPTASLTSTTVCPINNKCPGMRLASAVPCVEHTYQPEMGKANCICEEGYYCENKIDENPKICPVDHFCTRGLASAVSCVEHTYQPEMGKANCICEEGYYCENIDENPKICPVGHFCTQGASPVSCEAGTYQPDEGQSNCLDCTPGYYCPTASLTSTTICPINTKCPGMRLASAVPCIEQTYQSEMGKVNCICEEGYYCENMDENPKICPVGHFCTQGASLVSCEAGTYQPNEGQSICLDCTPGYYCPTASLTSTTVCPINNKCPGMRLASALPCVEHTYQPEMGKANCICEERYYCENIDENPKICPVDHFCTRGTKSPCPHGYIQTEVGKTYCDECVLYPYDSGVLSLTMSCKPSCSKYMTSLVDLIFKVTCDGCGTKVSSYEWSLRECVDENIEDCTHCFTAEVLQSTMDHVSVSHSNKKSWTYIGVVVKVVSNNGLVGMTSHVWRYIDTVSNDCEISPLMGVALETNFAVTCNEFSIPAEVSFVCSIYYAYSDIGDSVIIKGKDTCNHTGIVLRQGDRDSDYKLHINVVVKHLDNLIWDMPLILKVEMPNVTVESLESSVAELSGNLADSSTDEDIFEILNVLQAVIYTLNEKPSDKNITETNVTIVTTDLIAKEQNRQIRESVVETMTKVNTSNIDGIVAVSSTLNQATLNKDELSTEAKDQAFEMYDKFTEKFVEIEETATDEDVTKAAGSLLFGIGSVLDMTTDDSIEKPIKDKTEKLLRNIETINNIVFKRQEVDGEPTVFESPVISVVIDKVSANNLVGKEMKTGVDDDGGEGNATTSLTLPDDLLLPEASSSSEVNNSIRTEFVMMKKNPYIWGTNSEYIKAPVVSLELKDAYDHVINIRNLSNPIRITLSHDGGDVAGTIQFVCTVKKVNGTMNMIPGLHKPCAATFEIMIVREKVTAFSLSLPDDFPILLSIRLAEKFDMSNIANRTLGFRYPKDIPLIRKFYGYLRDNETEIFDDAAQYCKVCSEMCCNAVGMCIGFFEDCMYYCKFVLQSPYTENCTGITDVSVYCDICQKECCDGAVNCTAVLENCVFMCTLYNNGSISTECQTFLSDSYTQALGWSTKTYCEDCDYFCCVDYNTESCSRVYSNCVYFCSTFTAENETISCRDKARPDENIFFFPRNSVKDASYKMYFGLNVDPTDTKVLKRFKELDHTCLGNDSFINCSSEINIQIPVKVSSIGCDYWDVEREVWSTDGMQISGESHGNILVCTSDHLTAFSKTVLVTPTFIDPLGIELFGTFFDNPIVVTIVIVVWMIYFFLVYWARQKDKSDKEQVGINYCCDNIITHSYTYVICISTGWWSQAGTTANVYLYLKGSLDISPRKSLKTPVRKSFQTGFEDWFLITTEHSLGNITAVNLWHDNLGSSPHWFVNQVFVKDIHTDSSWTFVYNDWLAVDRGNLLMTTVTLQPVTEDELESKRKLNFMIMSTRNFRNSHIWISIFSKLACDTFTRVQRLTCCLSLLLTTMLTNLMFYGIPTDDPDDQLVTGGFKLSLSQFVIGIESALIMFPVNLLIIQLFAKVKQKPDEQYVPRPVEHYLDALFGAEWIESFKKVSSKFKLHARCGDEEEMPFIFEKPRPTEEAISEAVSNEMSKRENGKIFPWWFIYIAWSVSMTTCITSSYFVALYGLKYGYTRSIEWLVSFFTGFFQSVFIQQPIKVFGIAFILTLILKKTSSYIESVPKRKKDFEEDYIQSVCIKPPEVHQLVKEPLPNKLLKQIKERLRVEWLMNIMIRDVVLHVFYLAVVLTMVHGHRNVTQDFLNTETIRSLFVTPPHGKLMEQVCNADDFKEYLHDTLIPAISDITSDHEYATQGSNHYLVGTYRLRQLRIKAEICEPIISGLPYDCNGPYSVTGEDTSHYNRSWSKPWTVSAGSVNDGWKYRSTLELQTLPYPGTHGTYSGGGYVLELPANVSLHSGILFGLLSDGWIDDYTRAVFIEFTLYNPNVDLFTVVVYLFEFTNVGRVFPMNHEFTSSLYHYSTDYQIVVAICEILFVCLTILFVFVEVKKLKHIGKWKYFTNFWTFVELAQIALSIALLGLFIKRFQTIDVTLQEFKDTQGKRYINFYSAIFWDFVFGYVTAVLVALVILKTVKHMYYITPIKIISATLGQIGSVFRGVLFMFAIGSVSFAMLGQTLFGSHMKDYKTFYNSWESIIFTLMGVGDFIGLQDVFKFAGPVFIVTVIMTCQYGLLVTMIAILNVGRLETKHDLSKQEGSKFALAKYLKSRIKLMLDIKIK